MTPRDMTAAELRRHLKSLRVRARRDMTAAEFIELQGGLTNTQIAQSLGVSESTVVKWRGAQHPIPTPAAIAMRALFGGEL